MPIRNFDNDLFSGGRTVGRDVRGLYGYLNNRRVSNAFISGIGESLGFHYHKSAGIYSNRGWMGLRSGSMSSMAKSVNRAYVKRGSRAALGRSAKYLSRFAGRAFLPGMTLYGAWQGFEEEGVWGAAKSIGTDAVVWGGMKAAGAILGSAGAWATGGVAIAAYAGYEIGEAAIEHRKGLRHLEMGSPIVDPFGTAATLRQRSLAAMNNTHFNGRIAIGNEGFLLHS